MGKVLQFKPKQPVVPPTTEGEQETPESALTSVLQEIRDSYSKEEWDAMFAELDEDDEADEIDNLDNRDREDEV